MAVSKPLLTEFDIHHRLESCEPKNVDSDHTWAGRTVVVAMFRVRASLRPILKLVVDNILLASRPEKSVGFLTLHKMVEKQNKLNPSLLFLTSMSFPRHLLSSLLLRAHPSHFDIFEETGCVPVFSLFPSDTVSPSTFGMLSNYGGLIICEI